MQTGAITQYIDVAQIVLYVFWFFFIGLIFYLRREDRREGYPVEDERGVRKPSGFLFFAEPKKFVLPHGDQVVSKPDGIRDGDAPGEPIAPWPGAPLAPSGDPMDLGIGPGSYANRADVPDVTVDGDLKIVPMRSAADFSVADSDPDPRGMSVIGADGEQGGKVVDLWVDKSEVLIRYLEVETGADEEARRVLLPINFSRINASRSTVSVASINGAHFAKVPALAKAEQVTLLEEDKICAFYGAGTLYANPQRQEPLL